MENLLYYGDNLRVLKEMKSETVDLIYLDPPFNSKRDYNSFFSSDSEPSKAQILVFEDTWSWGPDAERLYLETVQFCNNSLLSEFLVAMRDMLGTSGNMLAYLTMMAPRLIEMHRVLKDTGSLFLHCDPTASHYIKLLLDAIFKQKNFRNEIVWCYRQGGRGQKSFAKKHDIIFFYSKGDNYKFNGDSVRVPYHGTGGFQTSNNGTTISGKTYLPNPSGKIPEDWWDIPAIPPMSNERVGYPTQKPLELLNRIVLAASDEGDVVLDPFCGCGTTIVAAERHNRQWIGIDVTHLAISTIKRRLGMVFDCVRPYKVCGEPIDIDGAKELAATDWFQFQIWSLSLLGVTQVLKKGADGGIDGIKYFEDAPSVLKKSVLQVKGGSVGVKDVRELYAVVKREKAELGILLTMNPPTSPMVSEAASYGIFTANNGRSFPTVQIVEIRDLLEHKASIYSLLPIK